jgi:hypothetical protein
LAASVNSVPAVRRCDVTEAKQDVQNNATTTTDALGEDIGCQGNLGKCKMHRLECSFCRFTDEVAHSMAMAPARHFAVEAKEHYQSIDPLPRNAMAGKAVQPWKECYPIELVL